MTRPVSLSLAAGLALLLGAQVSSAPADAVRFVACPIYRDTDAGRKSGCWLADDDASGRRFDISNAPTKPDWNFAVLVEGRESSKPAANCGAPVLEPARVSVLPFACTRHMLPAEGFTGNVYTLPPRNVRPIAEARPAPQEMPAERTFHLFFDFDKTFVVYQLDDYFLDQAITYIRAANPKAIVVTGWAATTPAAVSGRTLAESTTVAQRRAETTKEALLRLGVDPKILTVTWKNSAQPIDGDDTDGLVEASRRRVDIVVKR